MNLYDFEKHIDPVIIFRGREYYDNLAVQELKEHRSGEWIAEVEGTAVYQVILYLHGNKILNWDCDCPYDLGPICKHVVAVLYAIREIFIAEKEKGTQKQSPPGKKKVERILEKVSKEDLEKFILQQFMTNHSFENVFVAHFAYLLEENPDQKYRTILLDAFNSALGKNQFIDDFQKEKLLATVFTLSQRARDFLNERNLRESLEICKALIELLPTFVPVMDEDYDLLREEMNSVFDILFEIAESAPPQLKEEFFEYCLAEYPKEKYRDMGINRDFLSLLGLLVMTEDQEKRFFEIIDKEIKAIDAGDYRIISLVEAKCDYLQSKNRKEEVQAIIEKYRHFSHFRKILIEQAIQAKEYDRARNLCQEGLDLAGKSFHVGQKKIWYDYLLKIAEKEQNNPVIRELSEKLFFDSYFEMDYYRKLKRTYSKEEWRDVCERIINKIKGPQKKGMYLYPRTLANLFIEEHYFNRLLELLELNKEDIHFISEFVDILMERYPAEVIRIFEKSIREFARNAGRRYYWQLVKYLDQLKALPGGTEKVKELVAYFRKEYRRRPAMLEILNKKFPET